MASPNLPLVHRLKSGVRPCSVTSPNWLTTERMHLHLGKKLVAMLGIVSDLDDVSSHLRFPSSYKIRHDRKLAVQKTI